MAPTWAGPGLLYLLLLSFRFCLKMGQNQSGPGGGGGSGGDKKDDKEKKKYEPPVPTRIGKRKKKGKGPEAANKLPQITPHSKCRLVHSCVHWLELMNGITLYGRFV